MNITFEKKVFIEAVALVARFAERRMATLPVLAGVAIVAGDDGVKFRATNLETGIDLRVEGSISTPGVIALPATILRDVASSLSGTGSVTIEQVGDTATISSGSAKSTVKTLSYEDFPSLPLPENKKTQFTLSGIILRELINAVASCASPSTVRPELASVLVSAEGGMVKAVATDSFRLAEKKVSVSGKVPPFSVLIPAKNAIDIVQTIPDGDVSVVADEHQCAFEWASGTLVTRLVAMSYPDYAQIIPKSFAAEATLLRKDFEGGLKRVSVFSDAFQKVRVNFDAKEKKVTLFSRNADVGDSAEPLAAAITGEGMELSFNHRYLGAPLSLIPSESITLSAGGIGRPLIIKGVGDTSFLYLVMPMNQ